VGKGRQVQTEGLFLVEKGRVEIRPVELSDPGPGSVQIEMKACGLCSADIAFFTGVVPLDMPALVGHEGVGVVSKVGPQVDGISIGDEVTMAAGGLFARHANCPVSRVTRLPADVEHFQHWLGEPVVCAVNALRACTVNPGDRVVVVGTGFMGLLILQGLRHEPTRELIAVEPRAKRLEVARQLGADYVLNPQSDGDKERIERLTRTGADLVFECAGTQDGLQLASDAVRRAGTLCIFSWHKGERSLDLGRWHTHGLRVLNVSPSMAPDFIQLLAPAVACLWRGIFNLEPLVTHTAPVEDAQELFETAAQAPEGFIKAAVLF